jgi:hypothetical protein
VDRPYANDLDALARELLIIGRQSPASAMMALSVLVDHVGERGAMSRLRTARQVAARAAVADAGSQAKLARALGVSEMLVSRLVRGVKRRPPPKASPNP